MIEFDYKSEALHYLDLMAKGKKVTQRAYCEQRQAETGFIVSFAYFKKTLGKIYAEKPSTRAMMPKPQRKPPAPRKPKKKPDGKKPRKKPGKPLPQETPDWEEIKKDYLSWRYATLKEVGLHIGMNSREKSFRDATAGWKAQRAKLPKPDLPASLDALAQERAVQKAQDIYADALEIHYSMLALLKKTSSCRDAWAEPDKSPWHSQMAIQVAIDMQKALEKIVPAIKGLESLRAIHKIFDDLSDGKIDIVHAALDMAKLGVTMPKPIEIMLTKHKPDDAPPDDGQLITDEAIMARRAELLAEIQTERVEFVRERKRVVAALKAETTDSFKAQQEVENGA
jgi:hypothetical protein